MFGFSQSSVQDSKQKKLKTFITRKILKRSPENMLLICDNAEDLMNRKHIQIKRVRKRYVATNVDCCQFINWRFVGRGKFIWRNVNRCNSKLEEEVYTNLNQLILEQSNGKLYLLLKQQGVLFAKYEVEGRSQQLSPKGRIIAEILTLTKQ